jgi:hypothetical protein
LGNLFKETHRLEEAEKFYRQAIRIQPRYPDAYINLGNLLKETQRFEEAEASYRKAIAISPGFSISYYNLGSLLVSRKRLEEGEAAYRQAIAHRPDYADAAWNLSLLLLSQGRYQEGWPLHEARYAPGFTHTNTIAPPGLFPQWQGQPLTGKSIFVLPEQGLGDQIQFIRYLPLLKEMGTTAITIACPPPLKPLLETLPGTDAVITNGEAFSDHDYWTFPLSLPGLCGTTLDSIPAQLPYLSADPARIQSWRPRLPSSGLRVGLVWKGSAGHKNDKHRSLPGLEALAPLWSIPGISFVSLQKGQAEDEARHPPANQPLLHLGSDIQDFADSAAIISQLDLLISVDTAAAHLAGALGKPCWVLLSAVGTDWRWMHDRTDSPWYPQVMRLFRQQQADDWQSVIIDVTSALKDWIALI